MISSLAFVWVDPAWGITMAFISTCPVPAPNSASQGPQPPQPILKERAAPRSSSIYPTLCAHSGSGALKDSLNNVQPMPSRRLTVWWERSLGSELKSEENQKEGRLRAVLRECRNISPTSSKVGFVIWGGRGLWVPSEE